MSVQEEHMFWKQRVGRELYFHRNYIDEKLKTMNFTPNHYYDKAILLTDKLQENPEEEVQKELERQTQLSEIVNKDLDRSHSKKQKVLSKMYLKQHYLPKNKQLYTYGGQFNIRELVPTNNDYQQNQEQSIKSFQNNNYNEQEIGQLKKDNIQQNYSMKDQAIETVSQKQSIKSLREKLSQNSASQNKQLINNYTDSVIQQQSKHYLNDKPLSRNSQQNQVYQNMKIYYPKGYPNQVSIIPKDKLQTYSQSMVGKNMNQYALKNSRSSMAFNDQLKKSMSSQNFQQDNNNNLCKNQLFRQQLEQSQQNPDKSLYSQKLSQFNLKRFDNEMSQIKSSQTPIQRSIHQSQLFKNQFASNNQKPQSIIQSKYSIRSSQKNASKQIMLQQEKVKKFEDIFSNKSKKSQNLQTQSQKSLLTVQSQYSLASQVELKKLRQELNTEKNERLKLENEVNQLKKLLSQNQESKY